MITEIASNPVKRLLSEGKPVFGTWATLVHHPKLMRLLAATGLDFVLLEMEHSDFTMRDIGAMALVARASGIVPIARPAGHKPHDLTRPLDSGAQGLLLPCIDTPDQLEAIMKVTKYYPRGERILNLRGAHTDYLKYDDVDAQIAHINAETVTIAMVETKTGLDALPEICEVDGLDAIMIGPDDLSQNLGVPGQLGHRLMNEATERVIEVCTAKKIPWGFSCQSIEAGRKWLDRGIQWMPLSNDANAIFNTFAPLASGLKAAAKR
ncbi:MAG TPA: aldolase/citrate lyase family protein [Rhizobiaceae bacterium]|nr:aldolase/citrate lyase family protein [Rhizobiaceae bacterium]